jgi:hypothetical protein
MSPMPAVRQHFPEVLALNAESVRFLSPLSAQRLEQLHAHAAYHKVVVEGAHVAAWCGVLTTAASDP